METTNTSPLVEKAHQLIAQYVEYIGLTKEQVYNAQKGNYRWVRGNTSFEVFIQTITFSPGVSRHYLQVYSPLLQVPTTNLLAFYRRLLELNDIKLGVKITIMPNSQSIFATYERDIRGMDYTELSICISDIECWSSDLKEILLKEFPDNSN